MRALEAGSVSGDVRLIGSEVERLEAKSVSGNIEFDAPGARRGSNRAIRGSHGDASAFLSVRSHSGSVVIAKK